MESAGLTLLIITDVRNRKTQAWPQRSTLILSSGRYSPDCGAATHVEEWLRRFFHPRCFLRKRSRQILYCPTQSAPRLRSRRALPARCVLDGGGPAVSC